MWTDCSGWPLDPTAPPSKGLDGKAIVYTIQSGNYIKVGRTKDLKQRIRMLSTACAEDLKVVCAWMVAEEFAPEMEAVVHRLLRERKVRGEWFWVLPADARLAMLRAAAHCLPEPKEWREEI